MDISYCYEHCQKGVISAKEFLQVDTSIFDAAFDFQLFTKDCFKTCPYKQAHVNNKDKES